MGVTNLGQRRWHNERKEATSRPECFERDSHTAVQKRFQVSFVSFTPPGNCGCGSNEESICKSSFLLYAGKWICGAPGECKKLGRGAVTMNTEVILGICKDVSGSSPCRFCDFDLPPHPIEPELEAKLVKHLSGCQCRQKPTPISAFQMLLFLSAPIIVPAQPSIVACSHSAQHFHPIPEPLQLHPKFALVNASPQCTQHF